MVGLGPIDELGAAALHARQARVPHRVQLAVRRREGDLRAPGEVADAADRAPPPQEAKQLTPGASLDEVLQHEK